VRRWWALVDWRHSKCSWYDDMTWLVTTVTKSKICNLHNIACRKRFTSSSNLEIHRRVHTGVRPYKCTVCDRAFSRSGILQNHMKARTHLLLCICFHYILYLYFIYFILYLYFIFYFICIIFYRWFRFRFIELVARRLKIDKLSKQQYTVQQNSTRQNAFGTSVNKSLNW